MRQEAWLVGSTTNAKPSNQCDASIVFVAEHVRNLPKEETVQVWTVWQDEHKLRCGRNLQDGLNLDMNSIQSTCNHRNLYLAHLQGSSACRTGFP